MEMAVADSTVEQARATAPAVHPAAVLASAFLTAKPTLQTLFFDRMRTYEETLDRPLMPHRLCGARLSFVRIARLRNR
jgi:hypothetical protein